MSVRKWAVRHPGIGVLHYDSEEEAVIAAGTAAEMLGKVGSDDPTPQRGREAAAPPRVDD